MPCARALKVLAGAASVGMWRLWGQCGTQHGGLPLGTAVLASERELLLSSEQRFYLLLLAFFRWTPIFCWFFCSRHSAKKHWNFHFRPVINYSFTLQWRLKPSWCWMPCSNNPDLVFFQKSLFCFSSVLKVLSFQFCFRVFEKSLLFCVVMVELVSLHRYSRVYILTATFIYILKLNVYMSSLPWDNTV